MVLIVTVVISAGVAAAQQTTPPCKPLIDRIAAQRDGLSAGIAQVLKDLRGRVEKERPDLLPKLSPVPPEPLPTGYGILPRIEPDPPELDASAAVPAESRGDLRGLSEWVSRESCFTFRISEEIASKKRSLDALVDDLLRYGEASGLPGR